MSETPRQAYVRLLDSREQYRSESHWFESIAEELLGLVESMLEAVVGESPPKKSLWVVDVSKSKDHWLEVNSPEEMWHAYVKRDGCLEVTHYFNVPPSAREKGADRLPIDDKCDTTVHICDLDEAIERLIMLRDIAKLHFGEEWPG